MRRPRGGTGVGNRGNTLQTTVLNIIGIVILSILTFTVVPTVFSHSKYIGNHEGRWDAIVLNKINSGNATFKVETDGAAKLILTGKFNATHQGKIKRDKFIITEGYLKDHKCPIVDFDNGFKIALIWDGVNADVTFNK